MNIKNLLLNVVLFSSISALVACGGSGGDTATDPTISGSVFASHVSGASLTVTDPNGNVVAGPVMTTASGGFVINIPAAALSSDLVFESNGGSFIDEATGKNTTASVMAAYVKGGTLSNGATVHATPGSTIIRHMVMQHTMTMTQAQNAFKNAFGFIPDHTIAPTDVTKPGAGADNAQKLAGLRAAIFSQLAKDLGLTPEQQFELCEAFAQDLSDDKLDGQSAAGQVAVGGMTIMENIRHRYVMALMNFHGSANDHSGLNNADIGQPPFAKVALTTKYRVEYIAGMMDAMAGKSTFTINVKDENGDGVPGVIPGVMPMMYMATHQHSTPVGGVVDEGDGNYTVTVYYVMPSVMMNGMSMGYWDLKFMVDTEEVHFYPPVMMAMGDTLMAKLKGQSPDMVMSMAGGMEGRTYFIFRDGLTGTAGNQTFKFFVAAKDTMMSFPAIDAGTPLNSSSGAVTVTSVMAEISTDGSSFSAATNNGSGSYESGGLSITDKVYIKLSVEIDSGGLQQKTTDGMAPDSVTDPATTNKFATFMVTP